jgi:hypothetical protein
LLPTGQPIAGAMLTVGINVCAGGGNVGRGPLPAETGSVAISPHAARESEARQTTLVIA